MRVELKQGKQVLAANPKGEGESKQLGVWGRVTQQDWPLPPRVWPAPSQFVGIWS